MARVLRLCVVLLSAGVLLVSIVRAGGAAGDSPVTKAVKTGDLAAVRKLIASGSDVNAQSSDGATALLWAAYHSDVDAMKVLIAAGAKPDIENKYGVAPLLQASRTGDTAVMETLLQAGADPKRTHPEGETPLMAASRSGSVPAVKLLLGRGVDINAAAAYQKETALMWAAGEGHVDVVDTLLNAGADPNLKAHITTLTERGRNADHPTGGFTALMWAARNGFEDVVKRLAKGGADLNLKNGDGASAAMIAIFNDRFDMARTLVELGSDANDGSLYFAVEMRDATTDQFAFDGSRLRPDHSNKMTALDLVKFLLEKGADAHKPFTGQMHSYSMPNSDRFDNSPLFRAAVASDAETLRVMGEMGVDLNKVPVVIAAQPPAEGAPAPAPGARGRGNPNAGRTALMVTMGGGRGPGMTGGPGLIREGKEPPYREPGSRKPVDAFAALLKAGANPNVKAPDGNTMVHLAATALNLDMIRALAEAGAKLDEPNNDKLTALDIAEGKQPEGARGGAGRGAGRGGAAPPPAGGGRGRGAAGGVTRAEVAAELRKLMGLPPAPPETVAPPADAEPATEDQQ